MKEIRDAYKILIWKSHRNKSKRVSEMNDKLQGI